MFWVCLLDELKVHLADVAVSEYRIDGVLKGSGWRGGAG